MLMYYLINKKDRSIRRLKLTLFNLFLIRSFHDIYIQVVLWMDGIGILIYLRPVYFIG